MWSTLEPVISSYQYLSMKSHQRNIRKFYVSIIIKNLLKVARNAISLYVVNVLLKMCVQVIP